MGAAALTDDGIKRMHELMRELERLAKKRDVYAYLLARWDYHAICYQASGRTRLVTDVERLFWRAERYNRLVLSTPARFRRSVAYYRAFLAACEARDGDAAERVIHESMRQTVADLAPSLPSEGE